MTTHTGTLTTFYFVGLRMLLLLHAIIPCLHTEIVIHICGSVNSELRTIYVMLLVCHCHARIISTWVSPPAYISCVWSYHNQLFTVHHSGYYYLVSLIFGTTIPTSFNILINYTLYICAWGHLIINCMYVATTLPCIACRVWRVQHAMLEACHLCCGGD